MKKFIYITILIFCSLRLASQNNCDNIIEEARDLYNAGNYDDCINKLENGLKTCSLSKSKKEDAYVLLINSNIEKDSLNGIDKNFRLLLTNSPTFKIKEYNGIDDFKKYFKNYYVYPRFTVGLRPHYCLPGVFSTKVYEVKSDIINESAYNASSYLNTNLFFEYRVLEKISFFVDAGIFTLDFNRELKNDFWQMNSHEQSTYFKLDIGNKYFYTPQKKLNFYISGGYSYQYLMKSQLTITQTLTEVTNPYVNNDSKEKSFTDPPVNMRNLRNATVYSLFLGEGVIYRIGYVGIGLDLRGYVAVNTINKKSARFQDPSPTLIQDYNYIDSDIRMAKLDFSIVFTYSIFKVKRKKVAHA